MRIILLLFGLMVSILRYMFKMAHMDQVITYELTPAGWPEKREAIRIFFISDLHKRSITPQLLAQIKEPQCIIIGGDLVDRKAPDYIKAEENIWTLRQFGVPIVFVWGNHDHEADRQKLLDIFKNNQVKVLENEYSTFIFGGSPVDLIGVDDVTKELGDLKKAMMGISGGNPKILISHNPAVTDQICRSDEIALTLSGHTHGGQIRILGYGPREKGGIKKRGNTTLIISQGYGTTDYPLRLGARPDALMVIIKPQEI